MILEETRTKDLAAGSRTDLLTSVVISLKHPALLEPEMALVITEGTRLREEGHRPLEVYALTPEQLQGCRTRKKQSDWPLANALCVGKQGISAVIAPRNGQ
jgi:hypothetical protein